MSQYFSRTYACEGNLALKPESRIGLRVVVGDAWPYASNGYEAASRPAVDSSAARDNVVDARQNTRARRLAICLSVMFVMFSVLSFGIDSRNALVAQDALSNQRSSIITVAKGDTLWGIAESHSVAGASTSDVLTWIKNQNHLETSSVQAGQSLIVPSGLLS